MPRSSDSSSEESSVYSGLEDDPRASTSECDSADENDDRVTQFDAEDSSDEEDLRNTIGNVPVRWYDEFEHVGYDWKGQKIAKPAKESEIGAFLQKMEDPNFWRSVRDRQTGSSIILDDQQAELISNIRDSKYPVVDYNPYQPFLDIFSQEVMQHPVTNRPEHKRSFIPSLIEKRKVGQLVHAIKMGWIKPRKPKTEKDEEPQYYDLWASDHQDALTKSQMARMKMHIPAPKLKLPGHAESYNPPKEFLFTPDEENEWKAKEPYERRTDIVPRSYASLREVPAYTDFVKERFERCLDLYLAPRQRKLKLNVDPNDLLPKLPKPQDLQPFPTVQSIVYTGHAGIVRCIAMEPKGQYLASGSDDKTVKVWEIATGRCVKTVPVDAIVHSMAWCPNVMVQLIAVAVENTMLMINPGIGDKLRVADSDAALARWRDEANKHHDDANENALSEWSWCHEKLQALGCRVCVQFTKPVRQVVWHGKGDYFATVAPDAASSAVLIHQLSKWKSQAPFSKRKGSVQKVLFHHSRPLFFVATQRHVLVYNLIKQELTRKLVATSQHISSLALHPRGDNLLVGGYDCKVSWFDLDLSVKPYKTLRHHNKAVRAVAYHAHYPLFASASDDGSVIVFHGMVYSDFQNALIVPVKILKGHKITDGLGILDCVFHPVQPWIFTAGADSTVRLYT